MDSDRGDGYDRLAWFYERYWAREYHAPAFSIFDRLALREIPRGARVLDLCCGTGHLARMLVDRGFKVTGLDCSPGMLAEASRKLPEAQWIAADVRDFGLPPIYRSAISGFEGISHILEESGLAAVFHNTFGALAPGGLFVFDLNTQEAYTGPWQKSSAVVEEDHLYVIRGRYDSGPALATTEITTMRLMSECGWKREDIRIRQRCYTPEVVGRVLQETGFREVSCQDAGVLGMQGDLAIGRVFFRARKPFEARSS